MVRGRVKVRGRVRVRKCHPVWQQKAAVRSLGARDRTGLFLGRFGGLVIGLE